MMRARINLGVLAGIAILSLRAWGSSQPKASINQEVSLRHPESSMVCLAFIFKVSNIANDTQKMLNEYDAYKKKKSGDPNVTTFAFMRDYINSKRELTSKLGPQSPAAFKELRQYAILTLKPSASANARFAVFCGWKRDLFLLFDPDASFISCVMPIEKFLEQYGGTALVVSPSQK